MNNHIRRASHLLWMGITGIFIAPGQTFASIVSLAVAACQVTLFISFGTMAVDVLNKALERAKIVVYLKEPLQMEKVFALQEKIRGYSGVEAVEYLSAGEDRAKNVKLLPQDLVSSIPYDTIPGQHCFEVTLRLGEGRQADIKSVLNFLKDLDAVDSVAEPPVGSAKIRAVASAIQYGRLLLSVSGIILCVTTLFFVMGTLTRTIDSRREEMEILRLVGATEAFVKVPLYIQGIIQGITGGLAGSILGVLAIARINAYLVSELGVGFRLPYNTSLNIFTALLGGFSVGVIGAFLATTGRRRQI